MVGIMIPFIRHFNSKLFSRKARTFPLKSYSKNSNKNNIRKINYFSISLKNQMHYDKNIFFFNIKKYPKSFFFNVKKKIYLYNLKNLIAIIK